MWLDPSLHFSEVPESKGEVNDLTLLLDEKWMMDTEVKYSIQAKRGRWFVIILFFSIHDPMKILLRLIDHYHSYEKAQTFASIFQRGIRKDARGTQKRLKHAYNICPN
jgi:hypothetical protein